jgi:hypothetical protein
MPPSLKHLATKFISITLFLKLIIFSYLGMVTQIEYRFGWLQRGNFAFLPLLALKNPLFVGFAVGFYFAE